MCPNGSLEKEGNQLGGHSDKHPSSLRAITGGEDPKVSSIIIILILTLITE